MKRVQRFVYDGKEWWGYSRMSGHDIHSLCSWARNVIMYYSEMP